MSLASTVRSVTDRIGLTGTPGLARALAEAEAHVDELRRAAVASDTAAAWKAHDDAEREAKRARMKLDAAVTADRERAQKEHEAEQAKLRADAAARASRLTREALRQRTAAIRQGYTEVILRTAALADQMRDLESELLAEAASLSALEARLSLPVHDRFPLIERLDAIMRFDAAEAAEEALRAQPPKHKAAQLRAAEVRSAVKA